MNSDTLLESLRGSTGLGRFSPLAAVKRMPLSDSSSSEAWEQYMSLLPAGLVLRNAQRPLLAGWLCPGPAEPSRLLVNTVEAPEESEASLSDRPQAGTDVPLHFPWAGRGDWVDEMEVRAHLESMLWSSCEFRTTLPNPPQRQDREDSTRTRFEDVVARLGGRRFAWLVMAEPLPGIDERIEERQAVLAALRNMQQSSVIQRDAELASAQLEDFQEHREGGLWRIRVLVGAPSRSEMKRVAPLLAGTVDLRAMPQRIRAGSGGQRLSEALSHAHDITSETTLGTVAALVGLPRGELPGIRLVRPPDFDVTPAHASGTVKLGQLLNFDDRAVGSLKVSTRTLNRHSFICGATGSGKSQTARTLLEELWRQEGTPWLAVEPAKSEYARMGGRLGPEGRVLVIKPGDLNTAPASLNPLEPERDFPLQSHADLVRALFLAAFEANEPFPQVLSQALTRCYNRAGWDLVTGAQTEPVKPKYKVNDPDRFVKGRYPTLAELQATARTVVDDIGYGREVASDIRGFVDVRIGSLCQGTPGRFFQGGHPLDVAALLQRNVVLELDPITADQDKAFLMGAVVIRIVEHLRMRYKNGDADGLQHVILIEEAHRLLKKVDSGPAAGAVELFASLLAEVRSYGEGVVIVEQIPSKIIPDVLKNTALKVMHRLPALEDRQVVGATMNLSDKQSEAVVAFEPGVAAVSMDGEDRPLRVKVTPGNNRESTQHIETTAPFRASRSRWCGIPCQEKRCTLSQINAARKLASEAASVVWVEAVTAGLITDYEPPRPRSVVRDHWQRDSRTVECALAESVERAVAARRPLLQPWVDADDFGDQLHAVLMALLTDAPFAVQDPLKWTAGLYRWRDARQALNQAVDIAGGRETAHKMPVHPQTQAWRSRGLFLDGNSLGAQHDAILNHPGFAHGSDVVVLGDVRTSGLHRAVMELAGATSRGRYHRALTHACSGSALASIVEETFDLLDESNTVS